MKYSNFKIIEQSEKVSIKLINSEILTFTKKDDQNFWISVYEENEWINIKGFDELGIEEDLSIPISSILFIKYH